MSNLKLNDKIRGLIYNTQHPYREAKDFLENIV